MSLDFTNPQLELQKREFNFKCAVIRKTINYKDDAHEGNQTADIVLLDPFEGQERDMFFTAWLNQALPDSRGVSKLEIPVYIASPIGMPTKLRFCQPDALYHKPYLFVVNLPIERMFNFNKEIATVDLKTFPQEALHTMGVVEGRNRI